MNLELLNKHINKYKKELKQNPEKFKNESKERKERREYYQSWTRDRILNMSEDDFSEYISKLWAMLIWGNKQYMVNKLIEDNGFEIIKSELAELLWGNVSITERWDRFRLKIKGMGPAMISELLSHVHPKDCMLWNRRAYVGLNYLGVENLPRYNYQVDGERYEELSELTKVISNALIKIGFKDADLLIADYFIWSELQVEGNLSQIHNKKGNDSIPDEVESIDELTSEFIHNEIRDKIADIGHWLGLESRTEVKVADGSVVDTLWEQTIGNMGRVVYVFEVQTKGSIDSLILNLLKAVNNPAVQAVIAVSDNKQIEKIKKHAAGVTALKDRLKYWDYERVLEVHESLESVNEEINSLGLVPELIGK